MLGLHVRSSRASCNQLHVLNIRSCYLQVRLGPLTPYAVSTLRHLREFFGVMFSIKTESASKTVFLSCIGAGVRNLNRKVT